MTVARSVRDVLTEHVRFEIDCIDRMYLNVYVPQLQYAAGLVGYVHRQLGLPIASTAPLARITDAFGAAVRRFARDNGNAWVDFAKGQRKDDVMHEQLQHFTARRGGGVHRPGPGEDQPVSHRETPRRQRRLPVPWRPCGQGLHTAMFPRRRPPRRLIGSSWGCATRASPTSPPMRSSPPPCAPSTRRT